MQTETFLSKKTKYHTLLDHLLFESFHLAIDITSEKAHIKNINAASFF